MLICSVVVEIIAEMWSWSSFINCFFSAILYWKLRMFGLYDFFRFLSMGSSKWVFPKNEIWLWGLPGFFFANLLFCWGKFYKVCRHTARLSSYIHLPMNSNLFFPLLLGIFRFLLTYTMVVLSLWQLYILYITIYGSIYYIYLRIF